MKKANKSDLESNQLYSEVNTLREETNIQFADFVENEQEDGNLQLMRQQPIVHAVESESKTKPVTIYYWMPKQRHLDELGMLNNKTKR